MANGPYVIGAQEFSDDLNDLGKKEAQKIIRKAEKTSLKPIKQDVLQTVPVDTGNLKAAISTRAAKRKRGRIAYEVKVDLQKAFYGKIVEFHFHYLEDAYEKGGEKAGDEAVALIADGIEAALLERKKLQEEAE